MLYFCYGSNLLLQRLQCRSPEARIHTVAVLEDYSLVFHKRGVDGSGKCHIERATDRPSRVHGVLAEIPRRSRAVLHRAEQGYDLCQIEVTTPAGKAEAHAFMARPEWLDSALRPFCWYKQYVLHGALQHELPAEYVAGIRNVLSVADADVSRAAVNRQVLESARLSGPDAGRCTEAAKAAGS